MRLKSENEHSLGVRTEAGLYNTSMVKVAVITRTKDRAVFLKRALQSVAQQTYKDYVHVIVNDGGDPQIVDSLVEKLNPETRAQVKVFHREESSNGPDTIFNESVDRVDSEYVVLHDDDDTWHEEFLARTVELLDSNQSVGGVVVRTEKVIERVDGKTIKQIKTMPYMPDVAVVSLYRQCIDNQLTPIAFIYRREAYEAVGKYDSSLPVVGDWEFGIRFLSKYDVEFLDPGFALAYYHHRQDKKDNSFAKHNHRYYFTKVANAYLRKDLAENRLGVGYIINSLRYENDARNALIKKLLPNFVVKILKRKIK